MAVSMVGRSESHGSCLRIPWYPKAVVGLLGSRDRVQGVPGAARLHWIGCILIWQAVGLQSSSPWCVKMIIAHQWVEPYPALSHFRVQGSRAGVGLLLGEAGPGA